MDGFNEFIFEKEKSISLYIENNYLPVGNYEIQFVLIDENDVVLDSLQSAIKLRIIPDSNGYETLPMEHRWEIETGV